MRRREFTALIGAAALADAVPALAQKSKRIPVVGVVFGATPLTDMAGSTPKAAPALGLVQGLRDLGWVDGQNITLERRSAEGQPTRAPELFAELLGRGVDVIVVGGARWLQDAALKATRSIPMVTDFTGDPVAAGLIASLARPGGNLTGVTQTTGVEFFSKGLQLLREMAPKITRVAIFAPRELQQLLLGIVPPPGVVVVPIEVEVAERYDAAFATVLAEQADALMVAGDPIIYFQSARIVAFAAQHGLPAIYPYRESVEGGGLMAYGSSTYGRFRQSARLVDRLLRGAKPQDVPTEQPTIFEMTINTTTAKALGLTVPAALIARADEVIE
jgi:putative tryptophan/tyrosine transport system substrate-binding protein